MKKSKENSPEEPLLCYINYPEQDYGTCWIFDPDVKIWVRIVDETWVVSKGDEIMVPFFALVKVFEIAKLLGWKPEKQIPSHSFQYEPSMKIDGNKIQKDGYFVTESWGEVHFEPNKIDKKDVTGLVAALSRFLEKPEVSSKMADFIKVPREVSDADVIDIYTLDPKAFFIEENLDFLEDFIEVIGDSGFVIEKNRVFERYFDGTSMEENGKGKYD